MILAASPEVNSVVPNSSLEDQGMEFVSFSDQPRNIDAMREMEAALLQKSKATPAVQIVASMIRAAAAKRASDIHIEPQSDETSIRLRVDGIPQRSSSNTELRLRHASVTHLMAAMNAISPVTKGASEFTSCSIWTILSARPFATPAGVT